MNFKEELIRKSALELAKLIASKELSAREVTSAFLERIEEVEPRVHAFINIFPDFARGEVSGVEARFQKDSENMPFAGVPTAIKDVLSTKGLATTCGSRMLENFIPVYDATVVKKVKDAGAILLGKTNMDEFAMGSSTETSYFGPTMNPWDTSRVPGGSSGGSAAAVASYEVPWAVGSDTGGSIRQPASLCGIVGMKPTYGLVSRYGLVAFASSLDQVGPMARNVKDCAALLGIIAGRDSLDDTSIQVRIPDYCGILEGNAKGARVGVVKELAGEGIESGVLDSFNEALDLLGKLGASIEEVSLPSFEYALSAYYIIAPAEASSNLARYDGVRYGFRTDEQVEDIWEMYAKTRAQGFGMEVKRRIMLGTYALSAGYYDQYYSKAQRIRTLIVKDFSSAWERYDLLVSPTSPTTAFRLGEKLTDPLTMYMSDICTIPVNLAGIPAISIPCGLSGGLPVGFQIMGPPLQESKVLDVAYAMESAIGFEKEMTKRVLLS